MRKLIIALCIISLIMYSNVSVAQVKPIVLKQFGNDIQGYIDLKQGKRHFTLNVVLPETNSTKTEIVFSNENEIKTRKDIQYFENKCIVDNSVKKTAYGLEWEIEITGVDGTWSVPIETALVWDKPDSIDFWTTWPDNQTKGNVDTWQDPFLSAPLGNLHLTYGGISPRSHTSFSIPIASSFFKGNNIGVSFIQSPADTILGMEMQTSIAGKIGFRHNRHRICPSNTIRIKHYIVLHESDWRAGLNWMVENFKSYFLTPNPLANKIAGCGSYSAYEGALDVEKYKKMAYSVNWRACFDFPYMGMFIPPVKSNDELWEKYKQFGVKTGDGFASVNRMNNSLIEFKKMGFYTLSYFNVTEAGNDIVYEYNKQKQKAHDNEDLWKDPNDFIYFQINKALLRPAEILPGWDKCPIYSNWEGCVAVDPGVPVYHDFLLEQAKRHIEKLPASDGIAIDRMDWLSFYNGGADDGISYYNGNKVSSMIVSWNNLMKKLGPLMHENNKVIFCNPIYSRIDLMNQMDGIWDEYGQVSTSLNLCAWMATHKPIIAWTSSIKDFKPNPDAYFQHHLYLGAFPTAPFPQNDHTINPDPVIESFYLDYGPLLNEIKGRVWILSPNIIEVIDNMAKVNIFNVNGRLIIPVIHGNEETNVSIKLRLPDSFISKKGYEVYVLHPAKSEWEKVNKIKYANEMNLNVPLKRGCALIKVVPL